MEEHIAEAREMRSTLSTLIDSIPSSAPAAGESPLPPAAGESPSAAAALKRRHHDDLEPKPIGGAAALAAKKMRPADGSSSSSSNNNDRKFTLDADGYVTVFTDGACTNNGRTGAKAGIGVWWGAHLRDINLSQAVVGGRHTNNTAEIQAVTMALGQAQGMKIKKLNLHTDSEFVINCMTKWIQNWKRNNWRTAKKEPVKNKEDLVALDTILQESGVKVKWTHVRGHRGVHGNEQADRLANAGAALAQ